MQIVGADEVVAQSLCSLAVCRWITASVVGLGAAEAIAGKELIAWRAKLGGLIHLNTVTVSASPTKSIQESNLDSEVCY